MSEQHYASVERREGEFTATAGDCVVARADHVLLLREVHGAKSLPPVAYFPPDSLERSRLVASDHQTHCPIKGDAAYYSIDTGGTRLANAAWCYPEPVAEAAEIGGYVAFYPGKVSVHPSID